MELIEVLLLLIAIAVWLLLFLWIYGMFFMGKDE